MQAIQQIIDEAWENRSSLQPGTAPAAIGEAVASVLDQLDQGRPARRRKD
jgi:2,3,4,5-tetrahydropyridine-2-carboxylate N-succinyltransferase